MTAAGFVWANLRRRPAHTLLALAAVTSAFMLHGLAFGITEGIRRSAVAHSMAVPSGILLGATFVSGIGMLLILLLTTNATAHSIRGRTHELAVLKALGFSHRRVLVLLLAEAAVPCVAGAVLGLSSARGLFAVLVAAIPALEVVPSPIYTMLMIAMAGVLALLVATISVVIPAARLARMDVAVLMRSAAPVSAAKYHQISTEPSHDTGGLRVVAPHDKQPASEIGNAMLARQIMVATRIGLSTLPSRLKGALLIAGAAGIVVFLLLVVLSTGEGIRVGLLGSGDASVVVLRSSASVLLDEGRVPEDLVARVIDAPGVAHATGGLPLVDAEVFGWADLVKRGDDKPGYAVLAGVGLSWPQVTPAFKLLSGRLPRPGTRELIVGMLAAREFSSLDSGIVQYAGETWRVVGTFTTHGWWDGYLVGNAAEVKAAPASSRGPARGTAVRVRLDSPEMFGAFHATVMSRLPRSVVVERETDYYKGFWRRVPKHLGYMALVLATLIGAGASLGTALVLHDSLEHRRREIATLRLLGFDSRAVAASVLAEGICLSVLGSLAGAALVWFLLDGTLINGAWNVVRITVDQQLLCVAIGWGAGIAIAGSMPLILGTLKHTALDAIRDLFAALPVVRSPRPRDSRMVSVRFA